jgi:hypothetical protein
LRHYAASRKVAGSVPDEVIRSFNWNNPSMPTIALEPTNPLTENGTRSLAGGKGLPMPKAGDLITITERTDKKMWEPQRLTALWASTVCYKCNFTLSLLLYVETCTFA